VIEKIIHKKKMLALIVRERYRRKKGITFFTQNESTQQFGYMKHKRDHVIKPHLHKKRLTKIYYTSEVILILKGILRVDFYNQFKKYLFSKILKPSDIIMLVSGGHGFKILKDVEMLEIKQGPYNLIKDKIKFENIDDNYIKLKK
jgi:hypothetical protein|tara:strand:- start:690 stop:1124 length:435 start_codon:yes stop_codon:yes gene_type:complete